MNNDDIEVKTNRSPEVHESRDLKFAFAICKHVKSNAIVLVKNGQTIGIGAGNFCDGQVRVTADLLGLSDEQPPFCKPIIEGKSLLGEKLKKWVTTEILK